MDINQVQISLGMTTMNRSSWSGKLLWVPRIPRYIQE